MSDYEHLVEIFEITEYRDDSVYKTKSHGERWVDIDEKPPNGFQYAPLSSEREMELITKGINSIRKKG